MASTPPAVPLSPYNVFWLLHVILELPMGILAFLSPRDLPFGDLTPTTVLVARVRRRTDADFWTGSEYLHVDYTCLYDVPPEGFVAGRPHTH